MGSWDSYTDNLIASGCTAAVVMSRSGQVYAQKGVTADPNHMAAMCKKIDAAEGSDELTNKMFVGTNKYLYVKRDLNDQSIQGKLMGGTGGMSMAWAKTVCLLGAWGENVVDGQGNTMVLKLCDYLKSSGY